MGMRKGLLLTILGLLLAGSLLGCGLLPLLPPTQKATSGSSSVAIPTPTSEPTPTPLPPSIIEEANAEERVLIDIYKRVNPAVVNIRVVKKVRGFRFEFEFPGFPKAPEEFFQEGEGSGFVYDKEGHIVTNNHVVEGAEEVKVTFADGTMVDAEVVGTDPDSDLAVIRVDIPPEKLHTVELGDSDRLEVGQRVVAIGNPFGLEGSMTTGIISALGRTMPLGRISTVVGGRFSIPNLIQTDAAINPGNSGGPLLDLHGRVIGVNTAIRSFTGSFAGVGFAVPVNLVKKVVPVLIEKGHYAYPWLGISGFDLRPEIVKAMDLPVERGALIIEVVKGSPADKVGLRGGDKRWTVKVEGEEVPLGGDVIVAVDGVRVRGMADLISYQVMKKEVGQEMELTLIREGKEIQVRVKLGERPRE